MKLKRHILLVVICLMFLALRGGAETVKTASDLIVQAHKHDNMYTLGPQANQQKALSFYQSALAAEPDDKQRLHILYRMAQLYGSAYELSKGEKPNFRKAIELNEQIIKSYPPEEPLTYKAASSICDHYTTLRDFESALGWAKKILEFDTAQISEAGAVAAKIRRYQKIAVDQIAYTADHISYLRNHGELRHISDKYHGTFIADRANERLVENMDKMPDLWAPQNNEPFSPTNHALQADFGTSTANTETQNDIQIQPDVTAKPAERHHPVEPNTIDISQKNKHTATEPRAPPRSYFKKYIVVAAGLIVLVLAAIIIRKRKTSS